MFGLIVKNATLTDGQTGIDTACAEGKIAAIEVGIAAETGEVIDAKGQLVSPPFVDPPFHMDAALSLGNPRMNLSGTLLGGIALWGELKPIQSIDNIISRALRNCELAVAKGMGAIRTHVDTCDDDLKGVQALLQVREQVKDYLDLQLVAFPQDGVLRDPSAMQNTLQHWIWA
ncbi:Cytosine deaminase [Ruegeria denitrificans]|uniref:Cytosine deaminase n=1 Tax=Ruegeria denitrificans TaxID=1715692 RepID=A0A0P1IKP4_9RHOB|nr:Cytosine deaminase [Ruegeria denitrificans]